MKKTQKSPKPKVKTSLLRALGKKLKLLCEKNQEDLKKKEDQSKFHDDLELKKEVLGDERPSLQERLDNLDWSQFDFGNLNPTEDFERKEDQRKFHDDLKLKKEVVPCDERPNLDDFDSSDSSYFDIANKQFDLGVPNSMVNYFGCEEQNESFSKTPTLIQFYKCDLCETPFSAEHFAILHLKMHHKLFKDFENLIKITQREIQY